MMRTLFFPLTRKRTHIENVTNISYTAVKFGLITCNMETTMSK